MYSDFAEIYDRLMQDIPYEGWVQYLHRLFEKHDIQPRRILDIGCGTGNVTVPLAKMGYEVTGLDLSEEMLALADQKARRDGISIKWIQQDMRSIDSGPVAFDLVISMTDSLNYINSPEDLEQVFHRVKTSLGGKQGWFIFDLNSLYKIKEVFGDNAFNLLDEEIAYIWDNFYDEQSKTCHMDLTFFVREADGRYRRFSESHSETGYEIEEIRGLLKNAGFSLEAVYQEGSFEKPSDTTERVYFVAKIIE